MTLVPSWWILLTKTLRTTNMTKQEEDNILVKAREIAASRMASLGVVSTPEEVAQLLQSDIGTEDHEVFCVVYLDSQNAVIAYEKVSHGTINEAAVYIREVVKSVLRQNAASIIVAHNHPSGHSCEPGELDLKLTKKLIEALKLIDVAVHDHIIVTPTQFTSMSREGLL